MGDGLNPSSNTLVTHAALILSVAFALSLAYEIYRATLKAGTSQHDSMRVLVTKGLPVYLIAGIVIYNLFSGVVWVGLTFSITAIAVSIFHYNPHIMLKRKPGILDWLEDLVFTGLLFVATALMIYAVLGMNLS